VNEQDYHLDTGILGTRYLLDVLSDLGHTDVAFRVATQRTYPGWGYMVIEGATTLWERWEKICGGGMNSHNHIMLGSVDAWFYRVLAGISAGSPGWKTIIFKPPRVNGLDSAEAAVRTVLGTASISWNTTDSGCELDVTVPIGASGTVYVPFLPVSQSVLVDGIRKWSGSTAVEAGGGDVVAHGREGQYVIFSIGSGKYRFQST
jgi:alpha-L-rhamnosidase